MNEQLAAGTFKVQFNCKPQRFLKAGVLFTRYTGAVTLFNPTHFAPKPLIRVYGCGEPGVGSDMAATVFADDAKVMAKGQVTIPKDVREVLGVNNGDRVAFAVNNGKVK